MNRVARRVSIVSAAGLLGVAALAGCSSSGSSAETSTSAASSEGSTGMLPPVIINIDETEATAKVGDFLDILVSDNNLAATTVSTDKPELVELTQAHEDEGEGGAKFNPGGKTLAPGVAIITVTDPEGSREITLTITE